MKNSPRKERIVVRKLRSLNKSEISGLIKHIHRHNHTDQFLAFTQDVLDFIKSKDESGGLDASIMAKWPKLNKKKLNVLFLELHDSLKQYIVFLSNTDGIVGKLTEAFHLLKFYRKKALGEFFDKSAENIETLLSEYGKKDSFFFEKHLQLAIERAEFYANKRQEINIRGKYSQELSDALDLYYFVFKLNISFIMVNFTKTIYKVDFDYGMLPSLVQHLEENEQSEPVISLYQKVLRLLQSNGDRQLYDELKLFVESNIGKIPKVQLLSAITVLTNMTFKAAKERNAYLNLLFDLYEFQIKHDLLGVYKTLRVRLFENIVKISLHVRGSEWARNFIEDFQDRLEPKVKIVSVPFNLALCDFHDGKYEACLKLLIAIEKKKCDVHVNLARRRLQIMAYYELDQKTLNGDPNQPERAIGSMKKFLHTKKNEIAEFHAKANLDFVRFVNRLIEANDRKRRQKLIEEIDETDVLPDKDWLLQTLAS